MSDRDDLVVRPMSWLALRNVVGCGLTGVVVDHAAHLDSEGRAALDYLCTRGVLVAR